MRSLFLLILISLSAHATVSDVELENLLRQLQTVGGLSHLKQRLIVDPVQSRGFAAITWNGMEATIYANPTAMRRETLNTWAFVLGHEIGHQILNHTGRAGSGEEFAADIYGGQLAMKAGYDPKPYILSMYARPNSCSLSHGCWHTRAENLETGLGQKVERPATYSSFSPTLGYQDHTNCECHGSHTTAYGPMVPVVTIPSLTSISGYEYVVSSGCIISGQ